MRLDGLPVSYIGHMYFRRHEQAMTRQQGVGIRFGNKVGGGPSLRLCVCLFCGYRDLDEKIDELSIVSWHVIEGRIGQKWVSVDRKKGKELDVNTLRNML